MARKRTKLTDQLRQAVEADNRTRYRIALDARIDHATMSRFMGGAGLSMEALDRLAEALDLELTKRRPTKKGR